MLFRSDIAILQFAANLEFLEALFYQEALAIFNDTDFTDAGFPPTTRQRFEQIAGHEAEHVQLITTVLGSDAPQACNYSLYAPPSLLCSAKPDRRCLAAPSRMSHRLCSCRQHWSKPVCRDTSVRSRR